MQIHPEILDQAIPVLTGEHPAGSAGLSELQNVLFPPFERAEALCNRGGEGRVRAVAGGLELFEEQFVQDGAAAFER